MSETANLATLRAENTGMARDLFEVIGVPFDRTSEMQRQLLGAFAFGMVFAVGQIPEADSAASSRLGDHAASGRFCLQHEAGGGFRRSAHRRVRRRVCASDHSCGDPPGHRRALSMAATADRRLAGEHRAGFPGDGRQHATGAVQPDIAVKRTWRWCIIPIVTPVPPWSVAEGVQRSRDFFSSGINSIWRSSGMHTRFNGAESVRTRKPALPGDTDRGHRALQWSQVR